MGLPSFDLREPRLEFRQAALPIKIDKLLVRFGIQHNELHLPIHRKGQWFALGFDPSG
jgi:hypothetical protein